MFGFALEYIIPFLILVIICIHQGLTGFEPSRKLFWTIVAYLILIIGLRFKIGPDWPGYYSTYEIVTRFQNFDLSRMVTATGMEQGFLTLNFIFAYFELPIWVFQLFIGALSVGLKSLTIARYSKFIFLGLLVYLMPLMFFEDIIQIRQGLATGIALYSTRYIISKKFWMFFGLLLIGSTIHGSIFAFLPAYWLARVRLNTIVMFSLLILSVLSTNIGFVKFIKPIFELIPIGSIQRGFSYVGQETVGGGSFSFAEIGKIIFALIIIQYKKLITTLSPVTENFINLFYFSVVFFFFLRSDDIFAIRLTGYYSSTIIVVLPSVLYYLKNRKLDFNLMYFGFILYMILLCARFVNIHTEEFHSYYNFLYRNIEYFDRK